jgi:16S rRNA (guanine527-N7)-methyltransferase
MNSGSAAAASGREHFASLMDVSRETLERLDCYARLLEEWQGRMNLVSPTTLPRIWERHFLDSAQLLPIAGHGKRWLDIGAGGGFPGLVIAILDPTARLTLVDSIAKKCRFLAAVADATAVADRVTVANTRIEALATPPAAAAFDIITARAAAALDVLFDWGRRFATPHTRWILPKGARVEEELATAAARFHFRHDLIASQTDSQARIVVASGVKRR